MTSVTGRAPARVSLAGGGTDLPAYYSRYGGAVVSFAIELHATAEIAARSRDLELVSLDAPARELIPEAAVARRVRPPILAERFLLYQKAVAWRFGIERARISLTSEIPAGAGLASSGAVGVALVQAAAAFTGEQLDRARVAEIACEIEMELLKHGSGKQDQYASAFGGLNLIEFAGDGQVEVTPISIAAESAEALERKILLFDDGGRRSASLPLHEQAERSARDRGTIAALHRLKELAYEVRAHLESGDLDEVGRLLHTAWETKRALSSQVSTPGIERVYALARGAGALGGKLAGAGLAGTLVVYCPEERQARVREALAAEGWRARRVGMDWDGVVLGAPIGAGS